MARIAVIGAGGSIGSAVVEEAVARGHEVTAVVRDPARYRGWAPEALPGDVLRPEDVARVAAGRDVLVSAVGGGGAPGHPLIEPAARSLVEGLRALEGAAPRLIVVSGSGSLWTGPDTRVWDTPGLPDRLLRVMRAHGAALRYFQSVADVRWTALSPAREIGPGERTGRYRTGLEHLLTDAEGHSRISLADYAVALVDEIEQPEHIGERFTCCAE
ncbi:NAD(P)-dependent oxidoreductase [Kitasatospora sp. NPDC054939]